MANWKSEHIKPEHVGKPCFCMLIPDEETCYPHVGTVIDVGETSVTVRTVDHGTISVLPEHCYVLPSDVTHICQNLDHIYGYCKTPHRLMTRNKPSVSGYGCAGYAPTPVQFCRKPSGWDPDTLIKYVSCLKPRD